MLFYSLILFNHVCFATVLDILNKIRSCGSLFSLQEKLAANKQATGTATRMGDEDSVSVIQQLVLDYASFLHDTDL